MTRLQARLRATPGSRSRGQTLVEFAIILPFLMLLVATIVDFGFYLYDYIGTHSGIRAGTQAAIQAQDDGTPAHSDAQIKQIIQLGHGPINQIKDTEISIVPLAADPDFGGTHTSVTITINHQHAFIFPVYIMNNSPTIQIRSRIKTIRVPGLAP